MLLRKQPLHLTMTGIGSLLILACGYSIAVGPMDISVADSFKSLLPNLFSLPDHVQLVIMNIRLPRTVLCALVGAILALCGATMQGLFRNPLAEPGIIGVSAGASLGAAAAMVLFASINITNPILLNLFAVPVFAFVGGTVTTLIVYRLGTSKFGTSVTVMLLAGVAISALSGAAIGYFNYIADDQMLRDLTLWGMGSMAGATWSGIALAAITLAGLFWLFVKKAMALNALLLGEAEARHMGIEVQSLKRRLILTTAAGVGITVSLVGPIGFIGLVVPHITRMLTGPDHCKLIPVCAILGALLLTLADMVARVAVAPAELPVGIVTALFGAPFFLYLLFQQKGQTL
ncbi:iron ABC transporter permease [Vibrio sp. SCSIO 43136]|uniref:FecCD family ABC transporter permease n=1 Tax=Vibrio sp. SCSIO 43136 TaxID=2819101 RepID=UPI0020755340|nr:iron ABC transporter permease [Vibrio sp. SCSIO 43136]USD66800.1 iron ABC transporter permease [Vibrio sp. SCSIO 43136]